MIQQAFHLILNILNIKIFFFGSNVEPIKEVLKINNPILNGVVNNWEDMEKIWNYIFNDELKFNQEEYNRIDSDAKNKLVTPKDSNIIQVFFLYFLKGSKEFL